MIDTIEQSISNYNKQVEVALGQLKGVNSKYVCVNPDELRNRYETMHIIIEKKEKEFKERKDYINKCINDLEKCKKNIEEMEKVLIEIVQTSNNGRVGTLHGRFRQIIKEHGIPMDEIKEIIYKFPYDEQNEIKKYNHLFT